MEEGFGVRGKRRYVGEEEREEEIEDLRLWVLGVFAMVFSRAGFVVMRIYTPWLGLVLKMARLSSELELGFLEEAGY